MKKVFCLLVSLLVLVSCKREVKDAIMVDVLPKIYPDYVNVTIPMGIAPLNFNFAGYSFTAMDVVVKGSMGGEIHVQGTEAVFDIDDWHRLTKQNKGGDLLFTVSILKDGKWKQYRDFTIHVSNLPLEEWGLTYRRIAPGYEVYSSMGLYQRDLATFNEYPIIENTRLPGACFNCHTSNKTNPEQFVFHVRGDHGATMVQQDGKREWLKAKNDLLGGSMVYPYWHPSGKYCAFSTNQTRQGFHVVRNERIEVFDLSSDILVYNPSTYEILTDSLIATKDWSENVPVFSPDGKTLYFMTCKQQDYPLYFKDEKYNLCSISFDPDKGTFGNHVDTLFNAVKMGKSLTWPRPSYDGKYILFTLADYGYFSIWHNESEQWLLDLQTGEARLLTEINSKRADSYHNWSANSHWVVFTSRRDDGLYSRLYLTSVDEDGRFTKPFLLPQCHPWEYYSESLYSFNTPDFTNAKVSFDAFSAREEIMGDKRIETVVKEK
ncbi:MAG: PD40 domain-containing protein [Prevotella sp.]|nr:PD40 domain-containing protein [Prevotella sp.]